MLPTKVDMDIDAGDLTSYNKNAAGSLLCGNPTDRELQPTSISVDVDNKFTYSLPAYSFTVVRIKKELVGKR